MQNNSNWRYFFKFAAIFNFSAAFALIFTTELFFQLLGMQEIYRAEVLPWAHQFGVLVLTFGVGYWVISTDPEKHRDIIWMGCLGKTLVFVMAWVDCMSISALIPFGILVVADLIFAMFYGAYMMRGNRAASQRVTL
jgi:hypothetical protein